jgi:hypothetical protein
MATPTSPEPADPNLIPTQAFAPPGAQYYYPYPYPYPYYPYPLPVYVPPVEYHVPPSAITPPQMVPPKQGSLVQAWLSLAVNPSRQNFAGWAQSATSGWIAISIILAVVVGMIPSTLSFLTTLFANQTISYSSGTVPPSLGQSLIQLQIETVLFALLLVVVTILAVPLGQAIAMPAELGSFRKRYIRAMRPWALSLVGTYLVITLLQILSSHLLFLLDWELMLFGVDFWQSLSWLPWADFYLNTIFLLATVGYQTLMGIQAGSVGAAMGRWKVFATYLITSLVTSVTLYLVFIPIFVVQTISILQSIPTTTTP